MRIRRRTVVKKIEKTVLPGIRQGDKNVDWREVAERLLEQNGELTKEIERLQAIDPWSTFSTGFWHEGKTVPVYVAPNMPADRVMVLGGDLPIDWKIKPL